MKACRACLSWRYFVVDDKGKVDNKVRNFINLIEQKSLKKYVYLRTVLNKTFFPSTIDSLFFP